MKKNDDQVVLIVDSDEFRDWLQVYGWTQSSIIREMKERYGISCTPRMYSLYVNNKSPFNGSIALATAQILDVPFEQLFKLGKLSK